MSRFDFIQVADPQFGFRDRMARIGPQGIASLRAGEFLGPVEPLVERPDPEEDGLAREGRHLGAALAEASRRSAKFVVVCGDMVNSILEPRELKALRGATSALSAHIPIYFVPGNHDTAVDYTAARPTADGLAWYREAFGEHYYSFRVDDTFFLALNSELLMDSSLVPEEGARHFRFIEDALSSHEARTAAQRIVFMHRPLFSGSAARDHLQVVGQPRRQEITQLFRERGVRTVMAGHLHRNVESNDGDIEVIATAGAGYAFGGLPGFRSVAIDGETLSHTFHPIAVDPGSTD